MVHDEEVRNYLKLSHFSGKRLERNISEESTVESFRNAFSWPGCREKVAKPPLAATEKQQLDADLDRSGQSKKPLAEMLHSI